MEEEKSLVVFGEDSSAVEENADKSSESTEEKKPEGAPDEALIKVEEEPQKEQEGADEEDEEEIEKNEYDFSSDYAQQNAEKVTKSAFETMAQRTKRKKRIRTIITIAISAVLLLGFLVAIEIVFFKVNHYEISGETRYTAEQIISASGIKDGTNIYGIDKSSIEHNIIEKCPFIKSVRIYRTLPSTIRFEIQEEIPTYYFFIADEYFVLSESMRILDKTGNMGRLLLDYPNMKRLNTQSIKRAVVGEKVVFENEGFISYAEEMLTFFRQSPIWSSITTVDFSDRFSIFFVYEDRLKIILGDVSGVENKINIAEKIISSLDESERGTINVETNPAFYIIGK